MSKLAEKINKARQDVNRLGRNYDKRCVEAIQKELDEHNQPTGEAIDRAKGFLRNKGISPEFTSRFNQTDLDSRIVHWATVMVQFHNSEMEEALIKYSEFLEKHGYIDSDWWAEEPNTVKEFLKLDSNGK